MRNRRAIDAQWPCNAIKKYHAQALKGSPFNIEGLHVDVKEGKRKLNKILLAERKVFMTKLNSSRYFRSKTEGAAETTIQSLYRLSLLHL